MVVDGNKTETFEFFIQKPEFSFLQFTVHEIKAQFTIHVSILSMVFHGCLRRQSIFI